MSKKIRSFLSILLAVVMAVSSLVVVSAATASTDADVQAVVDAIAIDNDTTQASIEEAIKAEFTDAEIAWTDAFYKQEAVPEVQVKLNNEVYYTSESYKGLVSGVVAVTTGGNTYTAYIYREIAPAVEEVNCNSMTTVTFGADNTAATPAELLVVNPRADGIAQISTNEATAELAAAAKIVLVEGKFMGIKANVFNASANLVGIFAKTSAASNGGDWGEGSAIKDCPNFKYFYTGSFYNNGDKAVKLGFRFIYGTSRKNMDHLYFNFPGATVSCHSNAFALENQQVVFNCASITGFTKDTFYCVDKNVSLIFANKTVTDAVNAVEHASAPAYVYNMEDAGIPIDSNVALKTVLNGIIIDNDTTAASIEAAITANAADTTISWTQDFYKEMATPAVEVKLWNAETSAYDVYYTSESYKGLVSGALEVTVGDNTYNTFIYKSIAPATEEILCDSIGEAQYTNEGTVYDGEAAELIVVKGRTDDNVAVLNTTWLPAAKLANAKAIIVDANFRGFQSTNQVAASENLIGFFAKSSSQPNSGNWGTATTSTGAIHNCPNFKYFYTGSFINNGGKTLNLGVRFLGGSTRDNLKYLYFNFPGVQLNVSNYAFAFGNTEQVVFNVASVSGLAANSVYGANTNIICANTAVYNAFKAVAFEGQPKAIYNREASVIGGKYDADIQAKVDAIDVDNDTTVATLETAIKEATGATEITWTTDFVKVLATPKVEVKLANGNGGYDVYYTSESYAGSVTGIANIVVDANVYTIEVSKTLAPTTEEILCDSIDVHQYTDDNTEYYFGDAELLVVKGRSQDSVAVLKADQFDADSMKKVKVIIVDGNFRGFQSTKLVDSSENLIGFFAKSSSQPNSGNWGTASTSAGAIHNCPNFKYFYTGSFIDNGGKSINLGTRFIFGTSRNNLKQIYFNFPGVELKVSSYAYAFGDTEQVVFNVGSVSGLAANSVYGAKANIICANTSVYNAFDAITFEGQPKAIYNMDDVYAVRNTLAENIESIKLNFAGTHTFANSIGSSSSGTATILNAVKAALPAGITANLEAQDIIFDAAVDGGVIAQWPDIDGEDISPYILAITRTHNGNIAATVTLTKGTETARVTVEAPIYSVINYDKATDAFDETFIAELTVEETETVIKDKNGEDETYDVLVTGAQEDQGLLIIDGNELGALDGKRVFVKDEAFANKAYSAIIVKNAALGKGVFKGNSTLKVAYLGEGTTIAKELWNNHMDEQKTFTSCTSLKYVSYAEGIEKLGQQEFYNTAIEGFVAPTTLIDVRYGVFNAASKIKTVYFDPAAETQFRGSDIFNGANSLLSVRLPAGAKDLPGRLFTASSIRTVALGAGVETIAHDTFTGDMGALVLINYSENINFAEMESIVDKGRVPYKVYTTFGNDVYEFARTNGIDYEVIGNLNGDNVVNVLDLIALKKASLEENVTGAEYDLDGDAVKASAADVVAMKKLVVSANATTYNYIATEIDPKAEAMKKAVLGSANTVVPEGATVYYVDAVNGDDTAAGTTPETAWKSLDKVNALSDNYFSTTAQYVLFKRGGVWRGQITTKYNTVYGSYGEGDKPAIYGSPEDGGLDTAKWEVTSNTKVWKYVGASMAEVGGIVLDAGSKYEMFAEKVTPFYNAADGKFYTNGEFATEFDATKHLTKEGQFAYIPADGSNIGEGSTGTLYFFGSTKNPAEEYGSIEFHANLSPFVVNVSKVTIDNFTIKYTGNHGVRIGDTNKWTDRSNVTVTNCEIAWVGGSVQNFNAETGAATRFGNGVEAWGNIINFKVENCYLYQIYDAAMTHQVGNYYNNVTYLNNIVEKANYGVEYFMNEKDNDSTLLQENITIEGNIIRYTGVGFCDTRPDPYAAAIRSSHNNYPSNNFVIKNNILDRSADYLVLIKSGLVEDLPVGTNNIAIQYRDATYGDTGMGRYVGAEEIEGRGYEFTNFANAESMAIFFQRFGAAKFFVLN